MTAIIPLNAGLHTFTELYQKQPIATVANSYLNAVGTSYSATTDVIVAYSGPDTLGVANQVIPPATNGLASSGFLTAGDEITNIQSAITAGNLTVGGTGTLNLPTANNFSGTTYLAASPIVVPSTAVGSLAGTVAGGGTLIVGNNGSLGTSTLDFTDGTIESSSAVTLTNSIVLNGPAVIGGSNNLTFNGAGNVASASTLNDNNLGLTTFSGTLSGSGSLTVTGSGNVVLSGANTFSGGTTLAGGNIIVAGNSTGSGPTSGPVGTGHADPQRRHLAGRCRLPHPC